MDNKLILVDLITLLYRDAERDGKGSDIPTFVRGVVDEIKANDAHIDVSSASDVIAALRTTVFWMLDHGTDVPFNREELLQRIRVNVAEETYLADTIEKSTVPLDDQKLIADSVARIEMKLRQEDAKKRLRETMKKLYTDVSFNAEGLNWGTFVDTAISELEPYGAMMTGRSVHEEMLTEIDLDNIESMAEALNRARDLNSSEGVLRLGQQGFNKMLGAVGGIRRGDLVCLGALQHNYKSGALLHWPRMVAMYNKPYMMDETKKPLIIHITLENQAEDNAAIMCKWLKENETGVEYDIRDPEHNPVEEAQYIKEKLGVNGYHFKFFRFEGSNFNYSKLVALFRDLEREYEIHLCSIDYLNLMSKEGCMGGTDSAVIRDLFRRVRNYTNPRGIAVLTAHQLSSEAKQLKRQGVENFVKEVANKGYWADSKMIDQELDLEIIIDLARPGDGTTYFTAYRGKHRMPFITPESDLYTVYKFQEIGGLPDDLMGDSMALKKVGLGSVSDFMDSF